MKKLIVFAAALGLAASLPQSVAAEDGAAEPAGIGLFGVGLDLGYVSPEDIDGTIGFGGHANAGEVFTNFWLFPNLHYWSTSEDLGFTDISFSELSINAEGRYMFPSQSNVDFFGGGGLCICMKSAESAFRNPITDEIEKVDASDTDIGISLLGGITTALTEKIDGNAQLRYKLGDIDTFTIQVGATMKVGH